MAGGSPKRLVVIDTLAQFRKLSNGKGQLYPEDYAAISGLQRLASKYNVGIIIVHHDRKSEADDVFDTVSGTLGLTGAADTILIMKRQAGAVTLYVRGRDIEESEIAMQFDKLSCRWSILGTAADVHRSNERAAILKALETAGTDGLSVAEIMTATGSQNRHAMDSLLFKMLEADEVTRVRRGVYSFRRDAVVIGEKERNRGQDTENKAVNLNHTNHTNHNAHSVADRLSVASTLPQGNGQQAKDPWKDLDIPASLRREPLGAPAISAGPDDDLGDLE